MTEKLVEVGPYFTVLLYDPNGDRWEGGSISGSLVGPDDGEIFEAMADALESLVLAHACAGVQVDSPEYLEGVRTAVEACANNS